MDNRGFQLRLGLDIKDFKSSIDYSKKVALEAKKDYNALNRELKNSEQTYGTLSKQIKKADLALQEQEKVMLVVEKRLKELNKEEEKNGKLSASQVKEKLKLKNTFNDAARQAQILSGDINGLNKKLEKSYGQTAQVNKISKDLEKTYTSLGARASKAMDSLGSGVSKVGKGITEVGKAGTAFVSIPVAGTMATAAKSALDYGDQLNKLEAVLTEGNEATKKQKAELNGLNDTIYNLSSRFGVSKNVIADMATELVKSGMAADTTGIILENAMQGAMAAGEDTEGVIKALTGSMLSFGLKTDTTTQAMKNSSRTMDVLTYVANATKSGVIELGEGIAVAGSTLRNMGIDIDTTASAIGVLSQYNIEADVAARGLSTGLNRVVKSAKDATDGGKISAATQAFKDMGVDLKDIEKNGVNLPQLLSQIDEGTKGMTKSQKAANLVLAFGQDHMKTWATLTQDEAVKALNDYIKGCDEAAGSTEKMAKKMMESPKSAINIMKESLNNTLTIFGDGFLDVAAKPLAEWAQDLQRVAEKYRDLDDKQKTTINSIAGIAVVAPPAVVLLGKVIGSAGTLISTIGKIGKIKLSTLGIVGGILAISEPILDTIKNSDNLRKTLSDMWGTIKKEYKDSGLQKSLDELGDSIHDLLFGEDSKKGKGKKKTEDSFKELVENTMPIIKGFVDVLNAAVELIDKLPDGTLETITKFLLFKKVLDGVSGGILKMAGKMTDFKKNVTGLKASPTTAIKGVISSFGDTGKVIVKTSDKVVGLGKKIKDLSNDKKKKSQILEGIQNQLHDVEKQANDTKSSYGNLIEEVYGISGAFDTTTKNKKDKTKNNKNKNDKNDKNNFSGGSGLVDIANDAEKVKVKVNDANKSINTLYTNASGNSKNKGKVYFSSVSAGAKQLNDDLDKSISKVNGVYSAANGANNTKGKGVSAGKGTSAKGNKKGKIASTLISGASKVGEYAYFGEVIASLAGVDTSALSAISALADFAPALMTAATSPAVGVLAGVATFLAGKFVLLYNNNKDFQKTVKDLPKTFQENFPKAARQTVKLTDKMTKDFQNMSIGIKGAIGSLKIATWLNEEYSKANGDTKKFKENIFNEITSAMKKTAEKVLHWLLPDNIADRLLGKHKKGKKSAMEIIEQFSTDVVSKDGKRGIIPNWIKRTSSVMSNDKSITNATKKKAKESYNAVTKALGNVGISTGELVKGLGGEGGKYGKIKNNFPHYANGTDGHPGGLAMINDGFGPYHREAIFEPGRAPYIQEGRDVIKPLPRGTQVLDGRTTHEIFGNTPKYANGIGWIKKLWNGVKDLGSGIGKAVKSIIGNAEDWLDKPKELVQKVFDKVIGTFSKNPKTAFENITKNGVESSKPSVIKIVTDLLSSMFGDDGGEFGAHGDLGSNNWFQIDGNWVREWQYRLLEPIIKKYGFTVTDGGRRTWDNYDHSKGRAMDIAIPGNPLGTYWKVAQQIDKMPFVKYVNSNLKSTITGHWAPSNLEPRADHIHISFVKELLSKSELKATKGAKNPGGSGVERWRPYVKRALEANGLPTSSAYVNAWLRQIQTESNGDPSAMGGDDGLSDGRAMGLLQVKPPTFAANKHAGHNNIMNGYDNMLAAMRYAKRRYGSSGMLSVIGHGHGYENGGLITSHQLAEIGEGNKPEMIIPLTNKTRSVQLINKARKLVGEKEFETDMKPIEQQNQELKEVNNKLSNMIDLLMALLAKDTNMYLDGEKVTNKLAQGMTAATNKINRNIDRMHGIV